MADGIDIHEFYDRQLQEMTGGANTPVNIVRNIDVSSGVGQTLNDEGAKLLTKPVLDYHEYKKDSRLRVGKIVEVDNNDLTIHIKWDDTVDSTGGDTTEDAKPVKGTYVVPMADLFSTQNWGMFFIPTTGTRVIGWYRSGSTETYVLGFLPSNYPNTIKAFKDSVRNPIRKLNAGEILIQSYMGGMLDFDIEGKVTIADRNRRDYITVGNSEIDISGHDNIKMNTNGVQIDMGTASRPLETTGNPFAGIISTVLGAVTNPASLLKLASNPNQLLQSLDVQKTLNTFFQSIMGADGKTLPKFDFLTGDLYNEYKITVSKTKKDGTVGPIQCEMNLGCVMDDKGDIKKEIFNDVLFRIYTPNASISIDSSGAIILEGTKILYRKRNPAGALISGLTQMISSNGEMAT